MPPYMTPSPIAINSQGAQSLTTPLHTVITIAFYTTCTPLHIISHHIPTNHTTIPTKKNLQYCTSHHTSPNYILPDQSTPQHTTLHHSIPTEGRPLDGGLILRRQYGLGELEGNRFLQTTLRHGSSTRTLGKPVYWHSPEESYVLPLADNLMPLNGK